MQVVLFHIQCGQRRLAYVMSADERQRNHKLSYTKLDARSSGCASQLCSILGLNIRRLAYSAYDRVSFWSDRPDSWGGLVVAGDIEGLIV